MNFVPTRPLANPIAFRTASVDLWSPSDCDRVLEGISGESWSPVEVENDGEVVRSVQVQLPDFSLIAEQMERLLAAVCQVNEQYFRFDLSGIWDHDQPTIVRYEPGQGHYHWHSDCAEPSPLRKLSFSVLLSDPDSFAGGDLEVRGFDPAPRVRGTLFLFPSFMWHRVTPVTSGSRDVLVGWVLGPTFR